MITSRRFATLLLRVFLVMLLFYTVHRPSPLQAQDFMMQAWYWDYPKTCNGANWAGTLTGQAPTLAAAGFSYMWLPPMSRASFGSCSNGYDPQDLYDLGEYGQGATGFGTRANVDNCISAFRSQGVEVVADVVYNHRDGGKPESNPAVADYITLHYDISKNPFPSDRYRCVLPLGGSSGNGAGDYYFKISSKTGDSRFHFKPYTVYMETDVVGWQGQANLIENEPNGGGDCGEPFNNISLGINLSATVDGATCRTDEFKLTLSTSDFNAVGDQLYIYLTNANGDYSDHRVYGIWNASAASEVVGQLTYQTYTDFTGMPSGQGGMNFENYRPNSTNASTTRLNGDWDWLWFFYDYDQSQSDTRDELFDWTTWLWNDVGIRGFRMDAVKHFDPQFVADLMNHLHSQGIDPGMVVGEYFDGNPNVLNGWVNDVLSGMNGGTQAAIDMRVFDFTLRNALKNACDQFGYDVRNVFNSGIVDGVGGSPFNVVTFVNNHDFRGGGEPLQNDPILPYAYLLTNNQIGLPCVFYPDYFGVSIPNAPTQTLQPEIDALIEAHRQYIYQSNSVDYLSRFGTPYSSIYSSGFDNTTLLYQLSGGIGGQEVVVAINFAGEPLVLDHEINMTNVAQGDAFFDVIGHSGVEYFTVDVNNRLRIELPARSYSVWVQGAVPLPAELLHFEAQPTEEAVVLRWEVAAEYGLSAYEVEVASDGKQFESLTNIPARGHSLTYQYLDPSALQRPISYYRLKMMDEDGQVNYSPVRVVEMESPISQVQLLPNPTKGNTHLVLDQDIQEPLQLTVYSSLGQLIYQRRLTAEEASTWSIPTADWSPGLYWLQVRGSHWHWSSELIKTN